MFSAALVTKLFVSPLLIGLASLAGKRWGPGASGLLGGLPLVGAPVVLVLWFASGPEMAHRAAATAPIGVWATMTYLLVFGFASARYRWYAALGIGWVSYLLAAALLHYSGLDQQPWLGMAVVPALYVAATRVLPSPVGAPQVVHLPPQELLARMAAAVALILVLTSVAGVIGPDFTGVLAGAPVAATVIPAFTLAMAGRDPLLRALRGFLSGLLGFALFFIVLAALMPRLGFAALLPATVAAVFIGLIGARLVQRQQLALPPRGP